MPYMPLFEDCELNKSIGFASSVPFKSLLVAGDFNFPYINWNQEGGFCKNKGCLSKEVGVSPAITDQSL